MDVEMKIYYSHTKVIVGLIMLILLTAGLSTSAMTSLYASTDSLISTLGSSYATSNSSIGAILLSALEENQFNLVLGLGGAVLILGLLLFQHSIELINSDRTVSPAFFSREEREVADPDDDSTLAAIISCSDKNLNGKLHIENLLAEEEELVFENGEIVGVSSTRNQDAENEQPQDDANLKDGQYTFNIAGRTIETFIDLTHPDDNP